MTPLKKNPIILRVIARAMQDDCLNLKEILQLPLLRDAKITANQVYYAWESFGGKAKFPATVLSLTDEEIADSARVVLKEDELAFLAEHLRGNCLLQPAIDSLNVRSQRKLRPLDVVEFIQATFGSMITYRTHYGLSSG